MKNLIGIILFLLTFTSHVFCQRKHEIESYECYRAAIPINLSVIAPKLKIFANSNGFSERKIYTKINVKKDGSIKDIKVFNQLSKNIEVVQKILSEIQFAPFIHNCMIVEGNYFLTVYFSTNIEESSLNGKHFPLKESEELIISINN